MVIWVAVAVVALAQAAAATPSDLLRDAEWESRPSNYEIEYIYPDRALREAVIGRVGMICTVTADGRMEACAVESADPAGYEFEAAALRSTHLYIVKRLTKSGQPVAGRKIRITLNFVLQRAPQRPIALAVPGKVNARVSLDCRLMPTGLFEQCEVIDETPQDQGFGKAALIVPGKLLANKGDRPHKPGRVKLIIELRGRDAPKD